MKNSSSWVRAAQTALIASMALAFAWASPASAQSTLTPEGTVIKNVATVTYTDANGNTYAAARDSVMVTVGFLAGIDVIAGAPSVSVSAGSSNNTITFKIKNLSNGATGVDLALVNAPPAVATGISYIYAGNPYATLDLLEAAIGSIARGDSVTVTVEYDAAAGTGGLTDNLELAATTVRSTTGGGTASDDDNTDIVVTLSGTISVTPDDSPVGRLPSNGTEYTATFTVTNNQTGSDSFSLSATTPGPNTAGLSIVKMYFCDDSGQAAVTSVSLAAGAARDVCVTYTVANNAAGSTGSIVLTATSTTSGSVTDTGDYDITIIRPALTITKKAYLETVSGSDSTMSTTEVGASLVLPGQYIWYKIEVKNTGTTAASTVELVDQLPAEVTYISKTDDGGAAPAWTYTGADFPTGLLKAQLTTIAAPVSPATEVIRWVAVRVRIK